MLDRFIQLGYVVLNKVIPDDVASAAAAHLRSKRERANWESIFGQNDEFDPHRLQRRAPAEIGDDMSVRLREFWKPFYPLSEAKDWHALRSLPGGEKQPPHTDFTFESTFAHLDHVNVPAGMIVALEPGTHLYVYGWNRLCADMKEEKVVILDVGDVIIFRGDLIHAGGAYNTDNVRLHAFLDVPGFVRTPNDTNKIPTVFYDQGDLKDCPLHDCRFFGVPETVKKHILRTHRARFSNKATLLDHPSIRRSQPSESTLPLNPRKRKKPKADPSVVSVEPSVIDAPPSVKPSVKPTKQKAKPSAPTAKPSTKASVPAAKSSATVKPSVKTSVPAEPSVKPSVPAEPSAKPSVPAEPSAKTSVPAEPSAKTSVTVVKPSVPAAKPRATVKLYRPPYLPIAKPGAKPTVKPTVKPSATIVKQITKPSATIVKQTTKPSAVPRELSVESSELSGLSDLSGGSDESDFSGSEVSYDSELGEWTDGSSVCSTPPRKKRSLSGDQHKQPVKRLAV